MLDDSGGGFADGNERQGVVGLGLNAVCGTPEKRFILLAVVCPRGFGNEHGVVGQTLGLVHGAHRHAVLLPRAGAGAVERFLPVSKEKADVGGVLVEELQHLVVERIEVGRLPLGVGHVVQLEHFDNALAEFEERHAAQLVAHVGEDGRQGGPYLVGRGALNRHFALHVDSQKLRQFGDVDRVVRVGQHLQRADEDAYGRRGNELESLVGGNGDVGVGLVEVLHNLGGVLVSPHEHRHFVVGHALLLVQAQHLGIDVVVDQFVLRAPTVHSHSHVATVAPWPCLLRHVAVEGLREVGGQVCLVACLVVGRGEFIEHTHCLGEKRIVESHHLALAAEVVGHGAHVGMWHVALNVAQNAPVAASPAIDALLHVAHQDALVARREVLDKQASQHVPLYVRRVLKFVDHHVVEGGTGALKDK